MPSTSKPRFTRSSSANEGSDGRNDDDEGPGDPNEPTRAEKMDILNGLSYKQLVEVIIELEKKLLLGGS